MKARYLALAVVGIPSIFGIQGSSAPSARIHPEAKDQYCAILMWHDVVPAKKEVWFDVTARALEEQFAEIKRRKFNVITLDALYRELVTAAPLPPRPLVITFDDTTEGIYRYAFPLLKRYRFPATLFIHTDYVGVRTGKDHCTWSQLKEMQDSGLVSIQSHTRTHPADMRELSDAKLQEELAGSRRVIEQRLRRAAYAFAYTEGGHDARVRKAVAAAGYKIAIDEDWGNAGASKDLLQVHRYSVHRRWDQALDDVERAYRRAPKRDTKHRHNSLQKSVSRS